MPPKPPPWAPSHRTGPATIKSADHPKYRRGRGETRTVTHGRGSHPGARSGRSSGYFTCSYRLTRKSHSGRSWDGHHRSTLRHGPETCIQRRPFSRTLPSPPRGCRFSPVQWKHRCTAAGPPVPYLVGIVPEQTTASKPRLAPPGPPLAPPTYLASSIQLASRRPPRLRDDGAGLPSVCQVTREDGKMGPSQQALPAPVWLLLGPSQHPGLRPVLGHRG